MSVLRALLVGIVLVAIAVLSGLWLWGRLRSTPAPQTASAPTPTATATASVTPTALRAPPGYRLAGVAVGEPTSYAVIEAPNGSSALYHADADIPGLGKLIRIEAEHVVVQAEAGELTLWLAPAATVTPTPLRSPTGRAPTTRPGVTGRPAPTAAGRAPESTPSVGPGRPAS